MDELKCPGGHSIPNIIGGVSCGLDYCPQAKGKVGRPKNKTTPKVDYSQLRQTTKALVADVESQANAFTDLAAVQEQVATLTSAIARYEALRVYTKAPDAKTMEPEQIKDFVQKKMNDLSIDAIARIEHDLKLADSDTSRKLALEILDRTGHGKKETALAPGAPIIIVQSGGETKPYRPAFIVDSDK